MAAKAMHYVLSKYRAKFTNYNVKFLCIVFLRLFKKSYLTRASARGDRLRGWFYVK